MTPDLFACVDRANEAERAGDAATALEWHQAVPMFRRGRHRSILERLARLGDDLPPWVWARWIAYQAQRCEEPGSRAGDLQRQVLTYGVETLHADLLAESYREGGDPVRVAARVMGESWACHQLLAHEFGGMAAFIDELATGALADHADLARTWADVPLGGFRVGASLSGSRLEVHDAADDGVFDVLDLGARSCSGPDGWVLGRLVPSGVEDRLVFDMPPLAVPERLAREVAAVDGPDRWAPIIASIEQGWWSAQMFLREDYELTSDVPELELIRFGTEPREYHRVMAQLRGGRDEVGRAAYRILLGALDGKVGEADAAYVGAAAQNAYAHDEAQRRLIPSGQHEAWSRWAELVADPARVILRRFAEASRGAA